MSPLKNGMLNILFVLGFLAFPFTHTDSKATTVTTMNTLGLNQKDQIEKIVHDYLINHPEVLVEASQALQKKEDLSLQKQIENIIRKNRQAIFYKNHSPIIGKTQSTATIIEFFDYQCGYCKRIAPTIAAVINKDPKTQLILKQLPIFGSISEYAAKAVLAAQKQQKAWNLHQALMLYTHPLSKEIILSIAQKQNIDTNKLKQEMENPIYNEEVKQNIELADQLGVRGSPAFIIASGINDITGQSLSTIYIAGSVEQVEFEKALTHVRKNSQSK
ncbi:MAG: hypothetical protein LEGION0398_MBIBDBAK_00673 [Legionellaceae bacterium]